MRQPTFFVRFIRAIWTGLDGIRKALHLVLLLIVFIVFVGALSGSAPTFPSRAALVIKPSGALVEELEGDPFERAVEEMVGEARPQTVVQDIVDALRFAKDDDRIDAVHLDVGNVDSAGLAKLSRIGDAIDDFRSSGKPVIASGDFLTQQGYYLATRADEVYLHPEGALLLQGYGKYRMYYSDAIDLLRLDWNIFRVGTHKSYVEPYERMDMSDEDREATGQLIGQLWTMYVEDVANARELDAGAVIDYADHFVDRVRDTDGDLAEAALQQGLVDELLTRAELRERLIGHVGTDAEATDTYSAIDMREYLAQMRLLDGGRTEDRNVGIVVAAGEILFGSQSPGTIGADSTSALLRRARNDDSVKAVVLRVDSPGGSAFASDIIANEIAALQEAGKPVVASMSSVAASGGYWISVGTDRIFAYPSTITGSIGIFGMFPTYQRTIGRIGIATDGIGTAQMTGELRPDREMAPHTRELFQLAVEDGYDDFITRVATFRGVDKSSVDAIGQGRVWTGADALERGLVDELGTFEDAIEYAAGLAGLEEGEYGRKTIVTELSPAEQFLVDLVGTAGAAGIDLSGLVARRPALSQVAERLEEIVLPLLRFNDPRGIYAHCLCSFDY